MSKLLASFPESYTPSGTQTKILRHLEKAIDNKTKYIILRAPTGSGKSFISRALGNASKDCTLEFKRLIESYDAFKTDEFGEFLYEPDCMLEPSHGAFALTITKQLQDQYVGLFTDSSILKGKSNYKCNIDENFDVESAPCVLSNNLKKSCWSNNICSYYNQRNKMLCSKFGVLNYSMFLALPRHVKNKNYIICDEASELEEELTNRYGVNIDYNKLNIAGIKVKKVTSDKYDVIQRWVTDLGITITDVCEKLVEKANSKLSNLTVGDRIKLKFLNNLSRQIENVTERWHQCEFVVDKTAEKISLTPLNVSPLTKNIFDYGDHIVLMSATITKPELFAKTLGIKDYEFIDVESTFDAKKSPIYISTSTPLNYENLKKNLPLIAVKIQQLCDAHKDEKGIIHTHTSEICNYLQNKLKGERFIFRDETMNNEKMLEIHSNSSLPTVIVSPSLGYGTDLNGDKGRFQIIVKTPYPPLSNKRIKKKFDLDKTWYSNKTISTLIQMSGRCTRSKQDHSVTYILDATAYNLIKDNVKVLPPHFLDRIV